METNPRVRVPEWAPPPPVSVPETPPRPQPPAPPSQEHEFEDLLGSLVEHYSALPPPSFGESPVEETTATTLPRNRLTWLWAVAGVLVIVGAGAGVVLSGVVKLDGLGLSPGEQVKAKPKPAPAAPTADQVADKVKIRIKAPKAEPLPAAQPLATEASAKPEPAAAPAPAPKKVDKPIAAVSQIAKKKQTRKAHRPHRRIHRRHKAVSRRVTRAPRGTNDDWVDPYAQ